eukprot:ANDGO_00315.mRNA.1 Eukaryotic translation initiation factor 4E-1A-binding protein homolog
MSASGSGSVAGPKAIPTPMRGDVHVTDISQSVGGTMYGVTPGGTRIVYDRNLLLHLRNSPYSKTPPVLPDFSAKFANATNNSSSITTTTTTTATTNNNSTNVNNGSLNANHNYHNTNSSQNHAANGAAAAPAPSKQAPADDMFEME